MLHPNTCYVAYQGPVGVGIACGVDVVSIVGAVCGASGVQSPAAAELGGD